MVEGKGGAGLAAAASKVILLDSPFCRARPPRVGKVRNFIEHLCGRLPVVVVSHSLVRCSRSPTGSSVRLGKRERMSRPSPGLLIIAVSGRGAIS